MKLKLFRKQCRKFGKSQIFSLFKTLLLKKDLTLQQPSENITKSIFKFDDDLIGQLKTNPDNEVKEGVNEVEADVKTNLKLVDLVSESSTTQTKEQGTELIADEKCIQNKYGTPKVPPSDTAGVQKVGTPQTPLTAAIQKVGTPRTPLTAFIKKKHQNWRAEMALQSILNASRP